MRHKSQGKSVATYKEWEGSSQEEVGKVEWSIEHWTLTQETGVDTFFIYIMYASMQVVGM